MTTKNRPVLSSKKWRWLIGGVTILLTITYLVFSNVQGSAMHVLTIYELKTRGASSYGQGVRIGGIIDGQSIKWDIAEMLLEFTLVDGEETLSVTYKGARPDMFRAGAQVLVEGKYQPSGVFEATKLLLKCPSKYEAAATATAAK